jgi:hypothetical protein
MLIFCEDTNIFQKFLASIGLSRRRERNVLLSYEMWLTHCKVDFSKRIVGTDILVFDFEIFLGE